MPRDSRSPGVRIRRVVPSDWEKVRTLRLRALSSDPEAFSRTVAEESRIADSVWQERIRRGARSKLAATFVADSERTGLVGMVGVHWEARGFGIHAMWVAPEARGQGIGRKLLAAALQRARRARARSSVTLEVNPARLAAVSLYRSVGFEPTGTSRRLRPGSRARVREMRLNLLGTDKSRADAARARRQK